MYCSLFINELLIGFNCKFLMQRIKQEITHETSESKGLFLSLNEIRCDCIYFRIYEFCNICNCYSPVYFWEAVLKQSVLYFMWHVSKFEWTTLTYAQFIKHKLAYFCR